MDTRIARQRSVAISIATRLRFELLVLRRLRERSGMQVEPGESAGEHAPAMPSLASVYEAALLRDAEAVLAGERAVRP